MARSLFARHHLSARHTLRVTTRLEALEQRQLLAGDLIAHWLAHDLASELTDGATVEAWTDRVGQIEALASGTPMFSSDAAGGRGAMRFEASDGVDALRVAGNQNPLRQATDFSVVLVFSTNASGFDSGANWFQQTGLVDSNQLGFGADWGVAINGAGQVTAGITGGFAQPSTNVTSALGGLNDGELQTVVFTRQDDVLSLYVADNPPVTVSGAATTPRDAFTALAFGALQTGGGGFTGEIAEVRFYDGALSSAETAALRGEITAYYDNQVPVAMADSYSATEDTLLFIGPAQGVLGNDADPDGDGLTAVLINDVQHGSLSLNANGSFVYAPDPNFFGTDTFTYAARDFRNSPPVEVTIQIAPAYDPVTAVADAYRGFPSTPLDIFGLIGVLANDVNIDRASLRAVLDTPPAQGQLTLRDDGGFRYDSQGFAGTTSFTYRVDDGTSLSAPAEVTLVLNTAPAPQADVFTTPEDTALVRTRENGLLANDLDVDGDDLTVELLSEVSSGTLMLEPDGSFRYEPSENYVGTDSFTYRVHDGVDTSQPVTVTLTITAVNDAPVAVGDVYFGPLETPIDVTPDRGVLANDTDLDSTLLTSSLVTGPAHGTLELRADGSFRYVPAAGFSGTDGFVYRTSDGSIASADTEVRLFVGTSPVRISEIMVANVDGVETRVRDSAEASFRGDVLYPDWIELQNLSQGELDISGYHLTDNEFMTQLWQFPAGTTIAPGGFLVVYGGDVSVLDPDLDQTGRLHTNFNLSLESEFVAVSSPDGALLDAWTDRYPQQVPNVSYGVDASGELGFLREATPGAPNSAAYLGLTADTRFSVDRGFYTAPFEVAITTSMPEAAIYYSFDGTPPTPETGMLYTAPITIDRTTTLRAAAYRDNYLTPDVDTQTYLFLDSVLQQATAPVTGPTASPVSFPDRWGSQRSDYEMDPEIISDPAYADQMQAALTALPSLSLTLAFDDIFGRRGLYVNPQSTAEEPASAELIFPDGTRGFQIDAGARMQGGASRNPEHLKHSMSLRFREDYGDTALEYPLFAGSPVNTFSSIHLRARYNNSWIHWDQGQRNRGSMIREAWMRDTMLAAGEIAAGHGRYVHLYLNGLYWGIYEMHERQDSAHYANYFGGESWQYDATNAGVPVDGTRSSWSDLAAVVRSQDWQAIQGALDVDNHIRYTILQLFGGNQDLKADGNWRTAGGGLANAPWQFYVWDAERVLENVNQRGTSPVNDLLNFLRSLDDIDEYVVRFGDIIHELFFNDGPLTSEKTAARWMHRANELDLAIIAESARWGDARQAVPLTKNGHWLPEQNRLLETYFPNRTENVLQNQLRGRFYPATEAPEFLVNGQRQHGGALGSGDVLTILDPNTDAGTIHYTLDGTDPRLEGGAVNPTARVYNGVPIVLDQSTHIHMRVLREGEWSALSHAAFLTELPADSTNLRITEINYHPHAAAPQRGEMNVDAREFEFLELQNTGNVAINLQGVQLVQVPVDGERQGVVYGFAAQRLMPGERVVVVRNRDAFLSRYGQLQPAPVFAAGSDGVGGPEGQWSGGQLGDGGERITLLDAVGELIQQVDYRDGGAWPRHADGIGATLVLIDPQGETNDPDRWRASVTYGGTPGREETPAFSPVVVNEILSNSNAPQVDQIELYNPAGTTVDISHWFLSDSRNNLRRYQFPAGTTIGPNGYLVVDQNTFGFGLQGDNGDDVWLTVGSADGSIVAFADQVEFGATSPDTTLGRWPNGSGVLFPMMAASFGSENSGPTSSPLIISEIHYHPADVQTGYFADDSNASLHLEFVEVWNTQGESLPLAGWRLSDAIEFTFPAGATLPPGGTALVVAFDPAADPARTAAFRSHYSVLADQPLFGPYVGALDNGGETLELRQLLDGTDDVYPLRDSVRYDDDAPWPIGADGAGLSLQRTSATSFGNLAASWTAAAPTAGRIDTVDPGQYDLDGDGTVGILDIDLWCGEIRMGVMRADLDGDGTVAPSDLLFLVQNVLRTNPGDANLDGQFNSRDLVLVFQTGLYEDLISNNTTWASGDWNCDGEFSSRDLVVAFQAGAYMPLATGALPTLGSHVSSMTNSLAGAAFLPRNESPTESPPRFEPDRGIAALEHVIRSYDRVLLPTAVDSLFSNSGRKPRGGHVQKLLLAEPDELLDPWGEI